MKSKRFTYDYFQIDGVGRRRAVVLTKYITKRGTIRKDCGPLMAFDRYCEPPDTWMPAILEALDRLDRLDGESA